MKLPAELRAVVATPRYVLYAAPGSGYAEYAAIARRETAADARELLTRELAWLRRGDASRWALTRFDYRGSVPGGVVPIAGCVTGRIAYERAQPARFDVVARCDTPSAMVMKVTFHPNWRVMVDGSETETFMASPSYLAFALAPGEHFIVAEYRSTPLKAPLLVLGAVVLGGSALAGSRDRLRRLRQVLRERWAARR